MKKTISIVVILVVIGGYAIMQHIHSQKCKWIAPLKVNYVMCDDGEVRER